MGQCIDERDDAVVDVPNVDDVQREAGAVDIVLVHLRVMAAPRMLNVADDDGILGIGDVDEARAGRQADSENPTSTGLTGSARSRTVIPPRAR